MSELDEAKVLAERILDRPNADPDDDVAVLARQLLRALERADRYLGGLVFYASDLNWMPFSGMDAKLIREDRGFRARQAMADGKRSGDEMTQRRADD